MSIQSLFLLLFHIQAIKRQKKQNKTQTFLLVVIYFMHSQFCRDHGLIQGKISFSLRKSKFFWSKHLFFFPAVIYYWSFSVCDKNVDLWRVEWKFLRGCILLEKRPQKNFLTCFFFFFLSVVTLLMIILWRSNINYIYIYIGV